MRKAIDKKILKAVYNRVARRYDFQHYFFTAGSDQRGRRILVEKVVLPGSKILDCGAGTGSTALLALEKVGASGKVVLYDMSDGLLAVARKRIKAAGFSDRVEFVKGDLHDLPFDDNSFDVVFSTYSMCPISDPEKGVKELYRVTKPGGRIAVAHSTNPENPIMKWVADKVESFIWHFPSISLGCRSVSVLPVLERAGCKVTFKSRIGVPFWPFLVFVAAKPTN